jgi:hypothetical protein
MSVKRTVRNNPATTAGSIGAVVTIVGGRWLGWDAQLQADVATLCLVAVPVVRGLVAWWEKRHPVPDGPALP